MVYHLQQCTGHGKVLWERLEREWSRRGWHGTTVDVPWSASNGFEDTTAAVGDFASRSEDSLAARFVLLLAIY